MPVRQAYTHVVGSVVTVVMLRVTCNAWLGAPCYSHRHTCWRSSFSACLHVTIASDATIHKFATARGIAENTQDKLGIMPCRRKGPVTKPTRELQSSFSSLTPTDSTLTLTLSVGRQYVVPV